MKVFISWSGRRSRQIADSLAPWLDEVFEAADVEIFVSTQDISVGAKWSEVLNDELRKSSFGVLCLTPENLNAPWVLFEGGALSKTAGEGSVCPYLFDLSASDLRRPLDQFNSALANQEGTSRLVSSINKRLDDRKIFKALLDAQFNVLWPRLDAKLTSIPSIDSDAAIGVSRFQQELSGLLSAMKSKKAFTGNSYFAQVVADSLQQFKVTFEEPKPYFDVPVTLYPLHLVSLLKKTCPVVKAIAVVDSVEKFWPQKEGEEILKATPRDSTRVFVFREREHLIAHLNVLQKHANKYNVHALSYNRLAAEYPEFAQDFSIIGGTATPLLAYYVESASPERGGLPLKMIRFSASPAELSRHEEVMNGILNISTPIESADFSDENRVEALLDKLFTPEFKEFGKKQVEMSAYIEIDQYDAHEEEHAYYPEMMDNMVLILEKARRDAGGKIRILELGAGTGIFTKRLALLPNVEITALEIDWACFYLLKKNMAACESAMKSIGTTFNALNKDSRKLVELDKFNFILSSFSDHHIYFLDKEKYLRSVKKNLENDGLFIVGDEFLREHDETDAGARKAALEDYHQHIIERARKENHPVLVELEERALESGLRGWGDFKVSCNHYEQISARVGFKIFSKQKIGPLDADQIGGVYVYALNK